MVALKPSSAITFALPPEGKPKPDMPMGALVSFGKTGAAGKYQVTLSDEAWIDIVQGDAYRPSLEFTGVHGCRRVIRKSGDRFSVRSRAKHKTPITSIISGRIPA